jgi:poly-gamma-glutamate synthase PgsB/CapB
MLDVFRRRCAENNSEMTVSDETSIPLEVMRRFSYVEHPANVALALDVCEHLGVDREAALEGMTGAHPDPGALHVYHVLDEGREVRFLNALAANDAESTLQAWQRAMELFPEPGKRILLLNTRGDRFDRSVQLLEMVARHMEFDLLLSMGESTDMLTSHFRRVRIPAEKVLKLGHVKAGRAWDAIWENVEDRALVFALGNAGHGGLEVARLFRKRREQDG